MAAASLLAISFVAPLLADYQNSDARQVPHPAYHGRVVAELAVAVQLHELRQHAVDVALRRRTVDMPSELNSGPGLGGRPRRRAV